METKSFEVEIKADVDKRTMAGHAALFSVLGQNGDVIEPGAFRETIATRFAPPESDKKNRVRYLWNHDIHTPIGRIMQLKEDSQGLYFEAEATEGVQKAEESLALIKHGAINEMSFGFDTIEYRQDTHNPGDGDPVEARFLEKTKLYEISPVTFGANPDTDVSTKQIFGMLEGLPEVKEGRELSTQNIRRIARAIKRNEEAIDELKDMISDKFEGSVDDILGDDEKSSDEIEELKTVVTDFGDWVNSRI